MSAAIYTGRSNIRTAIVEKGMVGGQSANTLDIANYPGFPEGIDGPELAERMRQHADRFKTEFIMDEAALIDRNDDGTFCVTLRKREICSSVVIVATGSSPRKLGIPGEEAFYGKGVSYCGTCDGPFFRDRKVVVVGGGDSALKEGLHIARFASELVIVHRRDAFRAEQIYRDQVDATGNIKVRWNAVAKEIRGEAKVTGILLEDTVTGESEEMATDGVFIFIGTEPNTDFLKNLLPEEAGGHIRTGPDMMTGIPGLFAIGDVREGSYRQISTGIGEGATAAIEAEHYLKQLECEGPDCA